MFYLFVEMGVILDIVGIGHFSLCEIMCMLFVYIGPPVR